jgi:hypothetical protein
VFSNFLPGSDSFAATVVTETSVYLVVARQRTSGSGFTILAFRRHVTILFRHYHHASHILTMYICSTLCINTQPHIIVNGQKCDKWTEPSK